VDLYLHSHTCLHVEALTLPHATVALGGLVVACLPLDPRFAGSNPAKDDGFLRENKNLQHAFLRRRSKAIDPMS
jgi:hypothetical protein